MRSRWKMLFIHLNFLFALRRLICRRRCLDLAKSSSHIYRSLVNTKRLTERDISTRGSTTRFPNLCWSVKCLTCCAWSSSRAMVMLISCGERGILTPLAEIKILEQWHDVCIMSLGFETLHHYELSIVKTIVFSAKLQNYYGPIRLQHAPSYVKFVHVNKGQFCLLCKVFFLCVFLSGRCRLTFVCHYCCNQLFGKPVCDQLRRTSFEPDSVMEFGLKPCLQNDPWTER